MKHTRNVLEPDAPSYVGVNIGSLSIKVVHLRGEETCARVVGHQGRPLAVLERVLAEEESRKTGYVGVAGHLGHISEVAALQRALDELGDEFDAVASLGGESFLVYLLSGMRVIDVLSHNKCAAGSGEFFIQQIGRMGLAIDEAIERSFEGKTIPLASRCSVHCKSDITHKLNRQEAAVEDILHTLHDSMADKVVSLLRRARRESGRLLLIGGVARNRAMVAALREKLPETEITVLPESPYLEAWGAALITRDDPRHTSPQISVDPTLGQLPPLLRSRDLVQRIRPPQPRNAGEGPFVLGVDAGSTTTKAVLMDLDSREVVASHYGRTHGDPLGATKRCLQALAGQVGDRTVVLKGTTGSAREVVGAFLGTEHVYNEISAHAAGATHLDSEVDTIFEIGGQDSKYIRLRNGVPLDYAMNSACSAGTGSFLEESAQGDLGIPVTDIARTALRAESPVQFKATCAAFINSDIRIALQEGCSREDVAAGLVYSIANNYLTKVKGPRSVGKKVFLQGGVALNHAVGYAFAHSVGRDVVVPPHPELLGAQGAALLAIQRAGTVPKKESTLVSLALPVMKRRGRFTCNACSLFCTIDRFEVAGRRFPFGGRCSLFENVWKRKARRAAAPDLVEERAQKIFARPSVAEGTARRRIGIPRALTAHSLHPLYSTFLSRLGFEVVLSGVDSRGELMTHSGFCYPAQIAHGAVLDLVECGVNLVFFPHVVRMPNPSDSRDSYLCPITQASPYLLAHAFPDVRVLSPQVGFAKGYDDCTALVDMATGELGFGRRLAEEAFRAAVAAQLEAERSLRKLGKRALDEALTSREPSVILVGRSYNAFTPDASQSVGKKLSSMGIRVIPADCLESVMRGPTSWHFPNLIMNAVKHVKQHTNLFLLYVSNFSCTIDSFTHSMLASELGSKPYLMLETDAHTADGGIQTRLEAFLDVVRNYQHGLEKSRRRFAPAQLGAGGLVTTSSGEQVPLSDPRVRLHLPAFSAYHAQSGAMAMRWVGLNTGPDLTLERSQLERGLRYTSGGECLPLPICIGQLLQIHENRRPDEIAGMYMLRGGAPCVADSYAGYFERFIAEHELRDTFVFSPNSNNDYCGVGLTTLAQHVSLALHVADILSEIERVLRVVGKSGSVEALRQHWRDLVASASSAREFQARLPRLIDWLAGIPRTQDPSTLPRVVITGDFFTRFSDFFMDGVHERYTQHGIILKPVDLDELVLYSIYNGLANKARDWGLEPGLRATLKACTRFGTDGKSYMARWRGYKKLQQREATYRNRFRRTGLLISGPNDVSSAFQEASKHISPAIVGEAIPTIGRGLEAQREGYDGIILIGPFNCLPYRISEAILKPLCFERGIPILACESDGYAVAPAFLRQVDVHIQQVLQSRRSLHSRRPAPTPA